MSIKHVCPKHHDLSKLRLVEMEPISGYLFDEEQLPIYHIVGSSTIRPYKCPLCKLVEFYEETPEGDHYLIGEIRSKEKAINV